jgi:uncharacterized protein (TIGR02246 family)
MSNERQVLDLVQRWARAELDGDVDAYAGLLAPGFTGVGPVGFVLTAEQWAQRHNGNVTNHEFEVTDPRVRFYGDTAIVEAVQRQKTTAMGRDTSGSFRVGLVAVASGGGWAIAHIQLSGPMIAPGEMPSFAR